MRTRTTDTRWLNPKFFAAQIQIPIPNKYLGFGYKGLIFCRINGWIIEIVDKGLAVPKMSADKLAENTPNAQKSICPNCLGAQLCAQAEKFGISMKKGFIGRP